MSTSSRGSIQLEHPFKKYLNQKREEIYKYNRAKLSHKNILGKSSNRISVLGNKLSIY